MEMLSEHECEGWLEEWLNHPHTVFSCYEAFVRIIDWELSTNTASG